MSAVDTDAHHVWPAPNTHVDITVDWWPGPLGSRVEDTAESHLVLAGPTTPMNEPVTAKRGAEVLLRWMTPRGPAQLHASILGAEWGSPPLWTVAPAGEPEVDQRRSYARVDLAEPIVLAARGHEHPATLTDLSEGGMSCIVFTAARLQAGDTAGTVLLIDGEPLTLHAEVIRADADNDGRLTLAMQFRNVTNRDARRIRRHVFAQQVRRNKEGS